MEMYANCWNTKTFLLTTAIEVSTFTTSLEESVRLFVGTSYSFRCLASGRPAPKINWYKDGHLLNAVEDTTYHLLNATEDATYRLNHDRSV